MTRVLHILETSRNASRFAAELNTRFLQNVSGIEFNHVLQSIIEVLQTQLTTSFEVNNTIRVLESIIESCLKIRVLKSIIESRFAVNNRQFKNEARIYLEFA